MNQYDLQPLDPNQLRKMQFWAYVTLASFALFCGALLFGGCSEKEAMPSDCDFINGEWTAKDNTKIYLRFNDGELLSGSYWGDEIHIYDRYLYHCVCDTLFLTNTSTGYAHWLTIWNIGDSAAVVNGEYYGGVVYLKKL